MQRYISSFIFCLVVLYCVLWIASIPRSSIEWGVSFSHTHAAYLGLDWREVYTDMFTRLGVKYVRISAPWNEVEKKNGEFDFSNIDFMMDEAQKHGVKVALVLGQKAPRWPECHIPAWASALSGDAYEKAVASYIGTVVERYKTHEALELWQIENEPYIDFQFGECTAFREDLVEREVDLVAKLDSKHLRMITDSGELSFWKKASEQADILGTTLYRVVQTKNGSIFTYDWLPASAYKLRAMVLGRTRQNWYVAELQAEPWFVSEDVQKTLITIQEKTFSPKRFLHTAKYVEHVGVSRAYWWGVEWWYYADRVLQKHEYLETAERIIKAEK